MATLNTHAPKAPRPITHEGAPAVTINPGQQLRRSVMSCLLWEREFYEDGQTIADRIVETAALVPPQVLADTAVEARIRMHLRHTPLLLLDVLTRTGAGTAVVANTFDAVIQRADELAEFLAIYWRDGKHPLSAGAKRGLRRAFERFDAYQLTKYLGKGDKVSLRDVMAIVHPKPSEGMAETYRAIASDEAKAPDTWEVNLSSGADKRETFERLLRENRLGYLALLRNLRNMGTAGVDPELVIGAIVARRGAQNVLPFRYLAALRAAPRYLTALDAAMQAAVADLPELGGDTVVLVDVSGSMDAALSAKSDMTRMDAACALATFVRGQRRVFSFSKECREVPAFPGMAGIDAIRTSQTHGMTNLGAALKALPRAHRLIVITDEQSHDRVGAPNADVAYLINVAPAQNGVGYGNGWTHLDGFSENILRYVHEIEAER